MFYRDEYYLCFPSEIASWYEFSGFYIVLREEIASCYAAAVKTLLQRVYFSASFV